MRYLDGKPTDGRKYLGQPYVTSLSLLLVSSFKALLSGALAVAFTQHVWRILRHTPLRVSIIESLYGVRSNPLLLWNWRLLLTTPLLYLMAVVIWMLTIVVLFPPSALTVTLYQFKKEGSLLVSTFDAAYGRDVQLDEEPFIGTSSMSSWSLGDGSGAMPTMVYM
jgi:hypothetical protein